VHLAEGAEGWFDPLEYAGGVVYWSGEGAAGLYHAPPPPAPPPPPTPLPPPPSLPPSPPLSPPSPPIPSLPVASPAPPPPVSPPPEVADSWPLPAPLYKEVVISFCGVFGGIVAIALFVRGRRNMQRVLLKVGRCRLTLG